ncbi:MAG: hypothetical protein JNK30_05005 [Phenylobacterium sp.]|uniref:hypothetical protein n=1 Tax=Phenylobacterium sp. TaxID=1871053 RepID=UPI001A58E22A|nr:hypothetical protein [Phenylobacterium sp.]MBL8770720.1 hypothetical protein [Phenylobacterium sp.]
MSLPIEPLEPEAASGELVHWMAPGRLLLGPAGLATAFGAGLLLGLGALAVLNRRPSRRGPVPPLA